MQWWRAAWRWCLQADCPDAGYGGKSRGPRGDGRFRQRLAAAAVVEGCTIPVHAGMQQKPVFVRIPVALFFRANRQSRAQPCPMTGHLLQDIKARYPIWLERHADTLDHEVLARYTEQHQHIIDICHLYDTDEGNFDAIYAKLQQVLIAITTTTTTTTTVQPCAFV